MDTNEKHEHGSANLDPITKAPGAHPIGVGVGAAVGGMATGAAAGTLAAGPVGTIVGAAVGAVVGGLGGKAVAEHFDPTVEADYWREHHAQQSFYSEGQGYEAYEPAYQLGGMSRDKYANKSFEEAEPHLSRDYDAMRGEGHVEWDRARDATRAAWNRIREPS